MQVFLVFSNKFFDLLSLFKNQERQHRPLQSLLAGGSRIALSLVVEVEPA